MKWVWLHEVDVTDSTDNLDGLWDVEATGYKHNTSCVNCKITCFCPSIILESTTLLISAPLFPAPAH